MDDSVGVSHVMMMTGMNLCSPPIVLSGVNIFGLSSVAGLDGFRRSVNDIDDIVISKGLEE